jgi:hypothetical protein
MDTEIPYVKEAAPSSWRSEIFQRAMVGKLVFRLMAISRYVLPSAKARMSRARNTSPAGRVRDCAQRCKSSRCSDISLSKLRLSVMLDRRSKRAYVITGTLYYQEKAPTWGILQSCTLLKTFVPRAQRRIMSRQRPVKVQFKGGGQKCPPHTKLTGGRLMAHFPLYSLLSYRGAKH